MACTDIETGTGAKIRYLIQATCGEIPANVITSYSIHYTKLYDVSGLAGFWKMSQPA